MVNRKLLEEISGIINEVYGIQLLEYHNKNHLSGDNKSRCEEKLNLLKYVINLIDDNKDIRECYVKIKNPMQLYSEKVGKNFADVLREIINHDLLTNNEKTQRMYELFCEAYTDWMNSLKKY